MPLECFMLVSPGVPDGMIGIGHCCRAEAFTASRVMPFGKRVRQIRWRQ